EAGKVTLEYFCGTYQVEIKEDSSPVTIADRKTEEKLRQMISKEFPDHGILGEEFGETNPGAEYRWILDPIDGTKPFVAGVPQYTVLVALEHQDDGIIGVIHNPPLERTMVASQGNGCRLNGVPAHVSKTESLQDASVLSSCYSNFQKNYPRQIEEILRTCRFAPGWGDAFGYMLVAEGKCDVMIDAGLKVWDAGPIKVCIEEAGGIFTDWEGKASIHVENGVAANPALHREVLQILGE
ncbi:MAG: histidinol phosphate phosphatase, partial [Candidatus Omnitrophica bacterium]|nr:histidinol phosphate phosphatase [Candidatus Omnitrophota bacterium]